MSKENEVLYTQLEEQKEIYEEVISSLKDNLQEAKQIILDLEDDSRYLKQELEQKEQECKK